MQKWLLLYLMLPDASPAVEVIPRPGQASSYVCRPGFIICVQARHSSYVCTRRSSYVCRLLITSCHRFCPSISSAFSVQQCSNVGKFSHSSLEGKVGGYFCPSPHSVLTPMYGGGGGGQPWEIWSYGEIWLSFPTLQDLAHQSI